VQRLVTILLVEIVEHPQLLGSVNFIVGGIEIQYDRPGRGNVKIDKIINEAVADSQKIGSAYHIFQPAYCWLTRQGIALYRTAISYHFENRIVAQYLAVIGILVTTRYQGSSLGNNVLYRMVDVPCIPIIIDAIADGGNNANVLFRFPNNQGAGVGTDSTTVKLGFDYFPVELRETEFSVIFFHGSCSKFFFEPILSKSQV